MNTKLHNLRHSAAHLLAQAVLELYPETKITIGPVTETGFFYDFLPQKNFKEDDLPIIEKQMHKLVQRDYKIVGKQLPKAEARELFKNNPFKLEIINEVPADTVGVYWQGDFFDLCKGGHVESLGEIKNFKLMAISGSYWRADREGTPLQRITGIAFATEKDLKKHLKKIEEAAKYDHRRIGKQQNLFSFHEEAPGMPFFHDKGTFIYNKLISLLRNSLEKDYQEIRTPIILNESLWKKSGHYSFYKDNMYFTNIDDSPSCVKPMNCPGSVLLYKEKIHSYRELPLRLAEFGIDHRHELSGVLHGLFRVRAFTMDDAHIFCTPDQIEDEVFKLLELSQQTYKFFGFEKIDMALSTRPKKSMGRDQDWTEAIESLRKALERSSIAYTIQEGEGAFYGPKIEIIIQDTMERKWQCGTVQIDFNMPINFDLEYVASDQSKKKPIMIHRAIYGSIERFMGILLEHYKGTLPFWLSPIQARILTITDQQEEYALRIEKNMAEKGIRVQRDTSTDKISAQIKRAQLERIPWMIIIGNKEAENETVTLRHLDGKQEFGLSLEALGKKADELDRNSITT